MSRAERSWQPSDDLPGTVSGPSTLSMPDDWTMSTAWQRAQQESDDGGAINDAERIVTLSDGDDYHRVLWALKSRTLVAECDCQGYHYNDGWCAHVASLWWQWVRGRSSWPISTLGVSTQHHQHGSASTSIRPPTNTFLLPNSTRTLPVNSVASAFGSSPVTPTEWQALSAICWPTPASRWRAGDDGGPTHYTLTEGCGGCPPPYRPLETNPRFTATRVRATPTPVSTVSATSHPSADRRAA